MTPKTITASIPARKFMGREIKAMTRTFTMATEGRWTENGTAMLEEDVIDICSHATNWTAIRREHFPMVGF